MAGVDYPVSLFYKEILAVYPNVKVLLTERDPVKWYENVKGSILKVNTIQISWPQSFLSRVLGLYHQNRLPYEISCYSKDGVAPGKRLIKNTQSKPRPLQGSTRPCWEARRAPSSSTRIT